MFYSDTPIESRDKDQLGRTQFVKTIAQALLNLDAQETFSVGLYGKWGSGKTSLVNMLLEELEALQKGSSEEPPFIVIHFEPWHFTDSTQLLQQFFKQLSSTVQEEGGEALSTIGKLLVNYADVFDAASFIPVIGEVLATVGKKSVRKLGEQLQKENPKDDIQQQKYAIIKALRDQSQKILVIIDDIDRLSNEQIRQVFQLMGSIANFPNTIYLTVFDKDIVVKALEKVQEGSGEEYLEKIIQMPIAVPDVSREKMRNILLERMDEVIEQNKRNSFYPDHWGEVCDSCIHPFINNLRDVNRICNLLQFKLTGIGEEVDFADVTAITVLELKLPQVYDWVKANKSALTETYSILNEGVHLGQRPTYKELYEKYYAEIKEILISGSEDEDNVEMVMMFLAKLFPCFGQKIGKNYTTVDRDAWRRNNQIAHSEKFDRYFDFDLDNIAIKRSEVLDVVNSMDEKQFCTYLLECDQAGRSYELLQEISAMRSLLLPFRVKMLAQGLIDTAANLNGVKENKFFTRDVSRDAINLIIDLADLMPTSERFGFLSESITSADMTSFSAMANVINWTELAYGRLTSDGRERDGYKKIISEEDLDQLEDLFVQKAKQLLEEYSLFEMPDWQRCFYLLEYFAAEYIRNYLEDAFQNSCNILKYLSTTVSTWYGASIRYEIREDYQKYITEDQILTAIEATQRSGELFALSRRVQSMSVAFYLNHYEHEKYPDGIMQEDVNAVLSDWEDEAKGNR